MSRKKFAAGIACTVAALSCVSAIAATPLDSGQWVKVGHMSPVDDQYYNGYINGVFNGVCNLASTCTYGPDTAGDFWAPFPQTYSSQKMLFITTDRYAWALGAYGSIVPLTFAPQYSNFNPNITWLDASVSGASLGATDGNILTGDGGPWVTIQGSHCSNNCSTIIWGERNWNGDALHTALEIAHGGVDVYVSVSKPSVAPAVTGTLGANGWYVSPVSLSWSVALATSSAGCGSVGPLTDTKGRTYTCTATNDYGTTSIPLLIKQDTVKPAATIAVPANGATYKKSSEKSVSFSCADATSGVNSCVGTAATGSRLKTSTAGTFSFTVTATDKAGNVTTTTSSYKVQ